MINCCFIDLPGYKAEMVTEEERATLSELIAFYIRDPSITPIIVSQCKGDWTQESTIRIFDELANSPLRPRFAPVMPEPRPGTVTGIFLFPLVRTGACIMHDQPSILRF